VCLARGDPRVYELAFFAKKDIQAGTELTFDYLDKDGDGDDNSEIGDEVDGDEGRVTGVEHGEIGKEQPRCLCGAKKCRKWLWL
jgi:histone-lysine N-methyltransferase SUV39H